MKNITKLLLVICGVFLLTACGGESKDNKGNDKNNEEKGTRQINCKQEMGNETYDLVATLEDGKVVKVSVEANFENEENAATFEQFVSFIGETKSIDTGLNREGTRVTVENYAPVLELDDGTNKIVITGESQSNLVEILTQQNYKCE